MKLPRLIAVLPLLLILSVPVCAQSDWVKIAPYDQSFTFSMPTAAKSVARLIPVDETHSLPTRVLYCVSDGRRYVVVSLARTNPDRTPSLSNFREFVSAMDWSLTKAEGRTGSLTFDENLSDESGTVEQYRFQIGDFKGMAQFIGHENSFYALLVIGADKDDPDARRFLTSFQLGKKNDNNDPIATNVIGISEGEGPDQELPPSPWPKRFSPISGGVLNGKAIDLQLPKYPKAARQNHDEGIVKVRIVIDESGRVISAEGIEGPESLREAAIEAAYKSRFTPTKLMGQPVKVSGMIVYNFVAQ